MLPAVVLQHRVQRHKTQADQTVHLVGMEDNLLLVTLYLALREMVAAGQLF
jgi:hypothetical protein